MCSSNVFLKISPDTISPTMCSSSFPQHLFPQILFPTLFQIVLLKCSQNISPQYLFFKFCFPDVCSSTFPQHICSSTDVFQILFLNICFHTFFPHTYDYFGRKTPPARITHQSQKPGTPQAGVSPGRAPQARHGDTGQALHRPVPILARRGRRGIENMVQTLKHNRAAVTNSFIYVGFIAFPGRGETRIKGGTNQTQSCSVSFLTCEQ